MDPPPLDTVRWKVLSALNELQPQWSAGGIAAHTGLQLNTALKALSWLRERGLCQLRTWTAIDSLYEITQHGRDALAAGAQLTLDAK